MAASGDMYVGRGIPIQDHELLVVVVAVVDLFVVLVVLVHRIVGRRFRPMKNGAMVTVVACFVVLGLPDVAKPAAWQMM